MGQVNELKDFTRGQLDAALMKIGQDVEMSTREAIRAFLRDELKVVVKATKRAVDSLQELIKSRNFDGISPYITEERFPAPDRLWNDYKLFHFGEYVSSEDAVKQMQEDGYEPANSHELLLWDNWNEQDWIAALGSVAEVDGDLGVPCFCRHGSERYLHLRSWVDDWYGHYRFLAVCKSSGS